MYNVILQEHAERFLKKLDKFNRDRVIKKLEDLGNNARLGKPLTANLAGLWSLRIGKFRAIYQIRENELVVLVLDIGHRKNVYGN